MVDKSLEWSTWEVDGLGSDNGKAALNFYDRAIQIKIASRRSIGETG
jgi:hypothetical protein